MFKLIHIKILTEEFNMRLIKKIFTSLSVVLMFLSLLTFNQFAIAGELLVYSSTDADNLKFYMNNCC